MKKVLDANTVELLSVGKGGKIVRSYDLGPAMVSDWEIVGRKFIDILECERNLCCTPYIFSYFFFYVVIWEKISLWDPSYDYTKANTVKFLSS